MTRFRHFAVRLALLTIVLIAIGCSRAASERKIPNALRGVVSYDGEPVWQGQLTLLGSDGRVGTTQLTEDGRFSILNPPLGAVKVAVSNYPQGPVSPATTPSIVGLPGQAECQIPPRSFLELPRRFFEPDSSGIVIEIGAGESDIELVLPRHDGDPAVVKRTLNAVGVQAGEMAPEIRGDDLAGEPLVLSEHRGKVVALVFWAHWCNLCREQMPHYSELVERHKDRPFALLGVNCDPDQGLIHRENPRRGVNWRSWWDGASVGGPVTVAYQFNLFPCVMLIDHQGVIRHRNLRGADLDRAIDQLLSQLP